MARKRIVTLLILLLILGSLLLTGVYIYKSGLVPPKQLKENRQGASLVGLADATDNIHLDLIFNDKKLQDPHELVGNIQYLWGPFANQPIDPSIYTSAYVPLDWPAYIRVSFDWWKVNHPDWIVYKCDKITPAFVDPSYPNSVPLDISNPAVRNYQWDIYIMPFLKKGNNSIGFDNVLLENYSGKCGVWRNGVWKQLYSGKYNDPVYAHEVIDWAKEVYTRIHNYSSLAGVVFNMNILNSPISYRQLAPYADIILDEGGLTNFGNARKNYITDNQWLVQIQTIQNIIKLGKGFILNAYEPEMSYSDISSQEVQWDLSNYLLIKGRHTFTYVSVNPNSPVWRTFSDRPEYHVLIGHPISDIYASQGVYMRMYSNGLAIVNPSSTNSYHLNFGRPYQDVQGNTITSYTIEVHSGLILLNKMGTLSDAIPPALCRNFGVVVYASIDKRKQKFYRVV